MGTIKVTGKAQMKIKPDLARISLTLTGLEREYAEAVRKAAEQTEELRALLPGLGLERSDLKTLDIDVRAKHTTVRVEVKKVKTNTKGRKDGGMGRTRKTETSYVDEPRFEGYAFEHRMKLEFSPDNGLLGKVLYALAHAPMALKIGYEFAVRDPEAAQNALLAKAVADAREKAELMTRAAGAELKAIMRIGDPVDDGGDDYRFQPKYAAARMYDGCLCDVQAAKSPTNYAVDIEPDDFRSSAEVDVVWEIG